MVLKKKVSFVYEKATSVDFEEQNVKTQNNIISYDYLVIATGAKTNFFSFIDGLRENSYGVKKTSKST